MFTQTRVSGTMVAADVIVSRARAVAGRERAVVVSARHTLAAPHQGNATPWRPVN